MKIEQITPRLVTIKITQEKTDSDYGSCLWAVFQLDLDAYSMQIMSDCGNYAYGWCPTPSAESFLHLIARMDEDYLLEKISDRTVVDTKATYEAVKEYLDGLLDAEDVHDGYSDEQIRAACRTYYPRDCLSALVDALAFTDHGDAADQFELSECIETDYPADAKRIAALFRDYIRPMARKMDVEGAV